MTLRATNFNAYLCICSGIMLGIAFPPFQTGVFAAVGFVPFLVALQSAKSYGQAFRYTYLTFFVLNLLTLYWPGGFVHGKDGYLMISGILLLLAHPLFFYVPVAGWMFINRSIGLTAALIAFPFLWTGFEYLHSITEIAFPWLIVGNTQTYNLAAIQFASITGVYGISFWLLWLNVLAFVLYTNIASRRWIPISSPPIFMAVVIVVLYVLPKLQGNRLLREAALTPSDSTIRVGVIQPNIDPFEKWQGHAHRQVEILQEQTAEIAKDSVDLVVWPETAIPFYILRPEYLELLQGIHTQLDTNGMALLTGFPDMEIYYDPRLAQRSSKTAANGQRYDSFNSSMLLLPNVISVQKYSKIRLVPFAERVPFAETLSFLNAMQWNFGLGGWGVGRNLTVFEMQTERIPIARFSNLICYESIYPGFVAEFVRRGAQFLTIITNDSWWGNTSGAYQHNQYAVLRAIENRRWIVRCANGGISCFISPHGRILSPTQMFTQRTIAAGIALRSDLTFYTEHGDWFAQTCLVGALFFLVASVGSRFYRYVRTNAQ
jgi:apolipoprotein N-acyltransferase